MALPEWLQISQNSGSGDTVITITASTNETLYQRIYNLVVSGNTKSVSVNVSQDADSSALEYLTFNVSSPGVICWKKYSNYEATKTLQYNKNNGSWTSIYSSTAGATINVQAGDVVRFKGNNTSYSGSTFSGTTAGFSVSGNLMSLVNDSNYTSIYTISESYAFYSLFDSCTGMTNSSRLVLQATGLTTGCYQAMFNYCKSMTKGPSLPARNMSSFCYQHMFSDCMALTTAPKLPSTNLASYCYFYMFAGCSSLTTPPALPATTLTEGCYTNMFYSSSITEAPVLPATTLVKSCYQNMFLGCTHLNKITCLATNISATDCTKDWVKNVASSGVFTKSINMNNWTLNSVSGIPVGWTVQNV